MGMLFNKAKSASPFERPPVLAPVDPGMTMPQPVASLPGDALPAPRRSLFGAPMVSGLADAPVSLVPNAPDLSQLGPGISVAETRRPAFFDQGGAGRFVVGGIGDALLQWSGGQAQFAPAMRQQRAFEQQRTIEAARQQRQDSMRAQDRQWQVEDRDFAANRPQYFMSGEDRVSFDPTTGSTSVVYDGPTPAQSYASALGYEEGTPNYATALRDYVLRGSGPSATAFRSDLEDQRQGNRVALKGVPTYSQLNPRAPAGGGGNRGAPPRAPTMAGTMAPILAKVAKGQPLTSAEQQAWNMYRPGRRSGGGGGKAGGSVPRITSQAAYAALPKGSPYIAPDGSQRVKN